MLKREYERVVKPDEHLAIITDTDQVQTQKPKKIMRKRKALLRRKKAPRPITPTVTAKA